MKSVREISERINANNIITWLETEALKLGTDNQRERWAAMLLPEDEILQLARAELYKGFEGLPRWNTREDRREMAISMKHRYGCVHDNHGAAWAGSDRYEVADVAELTAKEWERLKKIQALTDALRVHPWLFRAEVVATVESHTHWLTCPGCEVEVTRSVSKVSIPWADHILVREYAL